MIDPRYWAWWQDKLAGKRVPMSEGTPYAGFYRWVKKDHYGGKRYATPVAYWPDEDGLMHCRIDNKDVDPVYGRDIWVNAGANPVPEDWYRNVTEKEPPDSDWMDGLPTKSDIGPNEPPEGIMKQLLQSAQQSDNWNYKSECLEELFRLLQEPLRELSAKAEERLKGPPVAEQVEADRLGKDAERLADLHKIAETARKIERAPHDDALKAIQQKWSPILALAEVYKNIKYKLLTPWQLAQQKALEEEARAAAAAGEPTVAEAARRPRVNTRGRAMALRTFKTAEITDFDKCLEFFKESPDIRSTLQDLANKAVRVGIEVPGVKVLEEQRTV